MYTKVYKSKKSKRNFWPRLNIVLAVALILAGSGLIFLSTLDQVKSYEMGSQKIEKEVAAGQSDLVKKPVKIFVPQINRTLDVSDGFIKDGRWKVAKTGVSYLTTSGHVGKVGNAVLYGHNTQGILGGLWRVQIGDIVEVTAESGKVYKYEIFERKEVKPNQVEILDQTQDSRLTIYTCSGFLDTARFVIVGRLVD